MTTSDAVRLGSREEQPMNRIMAVLRGIWFWTYDRGTWQYDVMCAAILMFIFLTPSSFFDERKKPARIPTPEAVRNLKGSPEFVSADELARVAPFPTTTLRTLLESAGTQKLGRHVSLKHFEVVKSETDIIIGYRVWFE